MVVNKGWTPRSLFQVPDRKKLRLLTQLRSVIPHGRCWPLADVLQAGHLLPDTTTMIGKLAMQSQQHAGHGRKSSVHKPDGYARGMRGGGRGREGEKCAARCGRSGLEESVWMGEGKGGCSHITPHLTSLCSLLFAFSLLFQGFCTLIWASRAALGTRNPHSPSSPSHPLRLQANPDALKGLLPLSLCSQQPATNLP